LRNNAIKGKKESGYRANREEQDGEKARFRESPPRPNGNPLTDEGEEKKYFETRRREERAGEALRWVEANTARVERWPLANSRSPASKVLKATSGIGPRKSTLTGQKERIVKKEKHTEEHRYVSKR